MSIKKFWYWAIFLTIVFTALQVLTSCTEQEVTVDQIERVLSTPTDKQEAHLKPVSITLINDVSQSTESKYEQPDLKQVHQLIEDYFLPRGGMFAVGQVSENGEKPFIEIFIEPIPKAPSEPVREEMNSFEYYEAMKAYKDEINTYEYLKAKREREIETRLAVFYRQLKGLWNQKRNARRSDIMGSLAQAKRHHAVNTKMQQVTILVSDGIDDVHKETPAISGDFLMVYASKKSHPELLNRATCYPSFNSLIQHLL